MATQTKNRNAIVIACCAAVAALAICALLIVLFMTGVFGGNNSSSTSTSHTGDSDVTQIGSKTVTVKAADGTEVTTLERPAIISSESVGETAKAAPALVRYIGTSPASGNTQSDQGGNKSGASGNATSSDQASNSQDEQGGSSESANNPYGNIADYTVAAGLSNVVNKDAFYLDKSLLGPLQQNGFVVSSGMGNYEFYEVYEANRYNKFASFVTVDSMMHAYHQYFAFLQENTEKSYLSDKLLSASKAALAASQEQQAELAGTEWEDAAKRNVAFFAVACALLDPTFQAPADVASEVQADVAAINAANGIAGSAITGTEEDFSQYKPRGYYEGDEKLERYFRTMMWYGRMNFTQQEESLNESALLMTLAMEDGNSGNPNPDWSTIYSVTSFFAGESDDLGFYEYYPCIKAAYGDESLADMPADEKGWTTFTDLIAKLEAPQINSLSRNVKIGGGEGDDKTLDESLDAAKGFRFMGQRFTLDESIFQQLVLPEVPDRKLPSALDLPAALGSDTALDILKEDGQADTPNYTTQLEKVRGEVADSDPAVWSNSLYSQWLYTLNPLLEEKGEGFPSFMDSDLWSRKNLNTYLGSYAELKHDTVLYSKQMMVEMGGGEITADDRGYVECEPEVFKRLAALSHATVDGLSSFGIISDKDKGNMNALADLATQLSTMAEKELAGTELSSAEYDLIRSYGGQLEHIWDEVNPDVTNTSASKSRENPAAIVVDIATYQTTALEIGTGNVSNLYVVVPIGGELHLCKGGVFTYYEFEWPASDRLTDSKWRTMLGIGNETAGSSSSAPEPVGWTAGYTVNTNYNF